MKNNLSYYKGSLVVTAICMILAYAFAGINGVVLALILSALEVSVSLDNAVVNAKVLQDMDEKWRKRFLTWGMLFSVFVVRILFPILIVWTTSSMTLWQSFVLPFEDANKYSETVQAAHLAIAGYGGAFLLMVFLAFFINEEKDHHWIPGLEHALSWLGKGSFTMSALIVATTILGCVTIATPAHEQESFSMSATWGIMTWIAVHLLGVLLEKFGDNSDTAKKAGLGAFIYLNILDASFSFDGVIGAFAVSNNIIVISAGLAAGAMFVRSMTIHMVDKGTLGSLRYLEHGAFWSIGILAAMMFIGINVHIPEILTGLSAAAVLVAAVIHSLMANKKDLAYGGS